MRLVNQEQGLVGYAPDAYLSIPVPALPYAVSAVLGRGGAITVGDVRVLGYYLDAVGAGMLAPELAGQANEAILAFVRVVLAWTGGRIPSQLASMLAGSWALQDICENLLQHSLQQQQPLDTGAASHLRMH